MSDYTEPSKQQKERAIEACANRTEDPLKNWIRPKNDECPICMLPLPFIPSEHKYCVTCGKTVCTGCMISTAVVHRRDGGDMEKAMEKANSCPFCREDCRKSVPDKDQYKLKQVMKRADAGHRNDIGRIGQYYFEGKMGLRQDKVEGLKWYHRAMEAGSGHAAFIIGSCYWGGDGVDEDHDKAFEYLQKAAELDFIPAFPLVGAMLVEKGEIEESMLSYRKAAMCGLSDGSTFKSLRYGFAEGYITKEEYAYTLRENQKAYNEMKSDGREFWKRHKTSR